MEIGKPNLTQCVRSWTWTAELVQDKYLCQKKKSDLFAAFRGVWDTFQLVRFKSAKNQLRIHF